MSVSGGAMSGRLAKLMTPQTLTAGDILAALAMVPADVGLKQAHKAAYWATTRHAEDRAFETAHCCVDGWVVASMVTAARTVPGKLLKERFALALTQARDAGQMLNKKDKKRLKEDIRSALLPSMPVIRNTLDVAINPSSGLIWIEATGGRKLDLVLTSLRSGVLGQGGGLVALDDRDAPELLTGQKNTATVHWGHLFASDATGIGYDLLLWLWYRMARGEFPQGLAWVVTGPVTFAAADDDGDAVTIKTSKALATQSARAALRERRRIASASVTIQHARTGASFDFKLDSTLGLKGLKILGTGYDSGMGERLAGVEVLREVLATIMAALCADRLTWPKADVAEWIASLTE